MTGLLDKGPRPCAFRAQSGGPPEQGPPPGAPSTGADHAPLPQPYLRRVAEIRCRYDSPPFRLGAPRPRPWRPALHRPARSLRPDADRRRPGFAGLQDCRDGARRMGYPRRRRGQGAHWPRPSTPTCRPAKSRFSRARSRCFRPPRNCRCRCSASPTIRRTSASSTASSTCAARRCTRTSSRAPRSSPRCAGAWARRASPSSRRRS